jgi:choline-sulfatase
MASSNPGIEKHRVTRGELLKGAAGVALLGSASAAVGAQARPQPRRASATRSVVGMNVLVFMTDQQRAVQHFPRGWSTRNMPGLSRLQSHGLTFQNAFTNACMCSPARSTFMSGYFPAQHGVKYTLETDMPSPQYPQVELATTFKNPATVVAAAGYTPVYKPRLQAPQAHG